MNTESQGKLNHHSPSHTRLLNQSFVSFHSGHAEQTTYSNTVITPLIGPKLSLVKHAEPRCAALDEVITYRLELSNTGNRSAEVTLYDEAPKGTAFVVNSLLVNGVPLPGIKPGSGIPLGRVEAGACTHVTFQAMVVMIPPDMEIINQAHACYEFQTQDGRLITDTIYSNEERVKVEGVRFFAHLSANTVHSFIGDIVTFTVAIANLGNCRMEHTILWPLIPPEGELVPGSVTIDDVYIPSSDPWQGITVGEILPGSFVRVVFRMEMVAIPESHQLAVQALVRSEVKEVPYEEMTNTVTIAVVRPEVTLRKQVNMTEATRGDTLRYEITAYNTSDLAIDGVLRDCLPRGALFLWDSITIDGQAMKGVQLSEGINLGTIRAHTEKVVSFAVTVPASALESSEDHGAEPLERRNEWLNQASLYYIYRMPDGRSVRETTLSNTVCTSLYAPIICLEIKATPATVEVGERVIFQIVLSNRGNLQADVRLAELFPSQTHPIMSSVVVEGRSNAQVVPSGLLPLGNVLPGQQVCIRYEARVDEMKEGSYMQGYVLALYSYTLNDTEYHDRVRSNGYKILVDDQYE